MCGWFFSLISSMTSLISGHAFGSFCNFLPLWSSFALLGECGLLGQEGSCSSCLCVCVCAVPRVLLVFSHLHPQELVRPQHAHGLREKVCLRLLLRHILGREVKSFCWWIYLGSANLVAFRQSIKLFHWNSYKFHVAPVVLLFLSVLFSNQTENPKSAHLDTITVQHLFEKQMMFVNTYGYEMVAPKQKPKTKWNKTPQLLQFCSMSLLYLWKRRRE